jgi:hypothetical protein
MAHVNEHEMLSAQSQQTGDVTFPRWQILLEPRYAFCPETPKRPQIP